MAEANEHFEYIGEELSTFAHAVNWKKYWFSQVRPYLKGELLEVGSGQGNNTQLLLQLPHLSSITCLEPDEKLSRIHQDAYQASAQAIPVTFTHGFTSSIPGEALFDTIVYIDVLEHIERDVKELSEAARLLKPEGYVVVLSPAHNFLFSEFDKAVGHFRRYTVNTLKALEVRSLCGIRFFYLDSVGMFASLANRLLMNQSSPNLKQIHFWDNWLVRTSRIIDPLIGRKLGKTVIGVWQKEALVDAGTSLS